MSEPRYVADADATRTAEGYGEGREPYRSRHADPYGTPVAGGGADAAGSGSRRSSVYSNGYPSADPSAQQPGRSRSDRRGYQPEYADPSGRAYGGGSVPGAGSGYPSSSYSAPTTYDAGGKTTYDTGGRRGFGGRSADRASSGYASPASRVASAMRRSVASATRGPRGPRRARLQLKHIDPWSTLKFSLVLAVALFVVWIVAVGILYGILDGMGVFDKVNSLYEAVTGKDGAQLIGPGLVLGIAALLGAINIVLFTALATIGSFIYNMCADLVGGVEVTLGEGD